MLVTIVREDVDPDVLYVGQAHFNWKALDGSLVLRLERPDMNPLFHWKPS